MASYVLDRCSDGRSFKKRLLFMFAVPVAFIVLLPGMALFPVLPPFPGDELHRLAPVVVKANSFRKRLGEWQTRGRSAFLIGPLFASCHEHRVFIWVT